ncbi:MAG: hypothetical protein RBS56_03880 [Candidatus Gracilibacteria bacterium]|nr:hypothetical protein [Candidatus Gracilibacteria bacterium]
MAKGLKNQGVPEKNLEKGGDLMSKQLEKENLKLNVELLMSEKFDEWRRISKSLSPEKQAEIENLIIGIEGEYEKINAFGLENISESDLENFKVALLSQSENMEKLLLEKKDEVLKKISDKYEKNKEQFLETLKSTKENLKKQILKNLPQKALQKIVNKKNLTVEAVIGAEIDKALSNLGYEVLVIPEKINQTSKFNNVDLILENLNSLNNASDLMTLTPNEYLNSLEAWDEKAEISSAIISDVKEYENALKFFFEEENIYEKLGIPANLGSEYTETQKLIKNRESKIFERFYGEIRFVKKYEKLPVLEIVNLKNEYEDMIMAQFVADTLNSQGKNFKREKKYSGELIQYLLNPLERNTGKLKSEIKSDLKENAGVKDNRSFDDKYFGYQKELYEKILEDPLLRKIVRINAVGEASGDKATVSIRKLIKPAGFIKEMDYFNDERYLKFKPLIEEMIEMDNLAGSEKEEKIKTFINKNKEALIAPEGLINLIYASIRIQEIAGKDKETLKNLMASGMVNVQIINHNKGKYGDKYKKARSYLMTQSTFDERKNIHADKMAFVDGISALENANLLYTAESESSDTGASEKDLLEGNNEVIDTMVSVGKNALNTAKKLLGFKTSEEDKKSDEEIDWFENEINDTVELNLTPTELLSKIPENAVINDVFVKNLEKLNGNKKLEPQDQKTLSEKTIKEETLENLALVKKYEEEHLAAKYMEEAFNPDLKEENIRYFKEIYKASTLNEQGEKTKTDETSDLNIPKISNEEAIKFLSENMESLKTPTTVGILKLYLENPILPDSSENEKELYKKAYEATYRENLVDPDEKVGEKFNKYMIARNVKNILAFNEKDIDALEFANEKNPTQLSKALTTWLKEFGYEDINKELETTGMNLSDEETRKKTITLLSIMGDMKTPEILLLKANITKTINEQMGLSESFTQSIEEIADLALGVKKADSKKQQKMAIDAFKIGIFRGENPKKPEMSDSEFDEKISEKESELLRETKAS